MVDTELKKDWENLIKGGTLVSIGIDQSGNYEDQLRSVCEAISALPDDQWDKIPDDVKSWSNKMVDDLKAGMEIVVEEPKAPKESKTPRESKTPKPTNKTGIAWRANTSAQAIFDTMKSAGSIGITVEGAIKSLTGKINSINLPLRINGTFREAVKRGLAKKEGKAFISI